MPENFWNFRFNDSMDFIETFDELPLWSAPFGLLLLRHLQMKPYAKVLDLGSGAGFPLFEIAERLGKTSQCFGLDPWKNANERARKKQSDYRASNVTIIEGSALNIPFEKNTVDLIVSNLGVNNFDEPITVLKECHRVMKPGAKLVLTTNINGHWAEFYKVFEGTLSRLGKTEQVQELKKQQDRRGTAATTRSLLETAGLRIIKSIEESFDMNFASGSAFLNHHFIQVGWFSSWQALVPEKEWEQMFTALEKDLNNYSEKHGELKLTVPMLYLEGEK